MLIYKIVDATEWSAASEEGAYNGSKDDLRDGFIHMSTAGQVSGTAQKHFAGVENLIILAFDQTDFGDELVWEESRGGALFPHIYSPLPVLKALWQKPMPLAPDGTPTVPDLMDAD